jgi:hypothetical protein
MLFSNHQIAASMRSNRLTNQYGNEFLINLAAELPRRLAPQTTDGAAGNVRPAAYPDRALRPTGDLP